MSKKIRNYQSIGDPKSMEETEIYIEIPQSIILN